MAREAVQLSKYTTEVRFICETYAGLVKSVGYNDIAEVLEKAWNKVFDFGFPIFDETYRKPLCIKILRHFYTREIGEETVGLWKLRLNTRMNNIMPYYNQLYKSTQIEFEPFEDTNLTRDHLLNKNENTKGEQNSNTTNNAVNRNLYSETPQGSLQNIENESYLTNARKITDDVTAKGENTYNQDVNSTDSYIEHLKGKSSTTSYMQLLKEYRDILINVDMQIIGELENLFMQIW